jgi:hypothetical protein
MAVVQETGMAVAGVGAGAGSTLLVRQQFDQTGETTLLRPSVLWGGVTGVAALGGSILMRQRGGRMSLPLGLIEDYGTGALAAGIVSAFSPKGAGVQLPTV